MKYCTFQFTILYNDGSQITGETPYRGDDLNSDMLKTYVKGYFAGPKALDGAEIAVIAIKEFSKPQEWITEIKNWESFKYLRNVNNFAGDLMAKYYPGE